MCLSLYVRLAKELVHEAQMHKLRHPNIVMLLAVIFEPSHYGVIFEYVTYGGLDGFIEDYLVGFCLLQQLVCWPRFGLVLKHLAAFGIICVKVK